MAMNDLTKGIRIQTEDTTQGIPICRKSDDDKPANLEYI